MTALPTMPHKPVTPAERERIERNREQAEIDWRGPFDHRAAEKWYWRALREAQRRVRHPVHRGGGRYSRRDRA